MMYIIILHDSKNNASNFPNHDSQYKLYNDHEILNCYHLSKLSNNRINSLRQICTIRRAISLPNKEHTIKIK